MNCVGDFLAETNRSLSNDGKLYHDKLAIGRSMWKALRGRICRGREDVGSKKSLGVIGSDTYTSCLD
jgi:hypothetical protein